MVYLNFICFIYLGLLSALSKNNPEIQSALLTYDAIEIVAKSLYIETSVDLITIALQFLANICYLNTEVTSAAIKIGMLDWCADAFVYSEFDSIKAQV